LTNGIADFVLAERDIELEPPGRLGMMLASEDAGVKIREVRPASPADKAGFLPGHRIRSIAREPVRNMQDVRLALLDRMPGEEVWVEYEPGVEPRNGRTQGRALTLL
jgi:C-terminal processing protease CtpA/Prc